MPTITIDKTMFKAGFASSNEESNGGLSPDDKGFNYYKGDGSILYPMPDKTVTDDVLEDQIIAGNYDKSGIGADSIFVGEDGYFYNLVGATLTEQQHETVNDYSEGTTNIIFFKDNVFCTAKEDIVKLNSSLTIIDHDWWTNTQSHSALGALVRHPMVVIEGSLYIADGNKIHLWDGSASQEAWMSLPSDVNITAMCKHPDGRHLVVFTSDSINYSHTTQAYGKVYIIDTVTAEFIQEVEIEEQVEGCWVQGGTVFVTYGKTFGFFDGNGLTPIRPLILNTSSPTALYTAIGAIFRDTIIMPESNSVFAYGNIYNSDKIPFYPYESSGSEDIVFTMPTGSNSICVVYKVSEAWHFATINFDDASHKSQVSAKFIKQSFAGKVWVRRVDLYLKENVATGGNQTNIFAYERGAVRSIGGIDFAVDGAIKTKERIMCNIFTDFFQIALQFGEADGYQGLEKMVIHYESGE